MRVEMTTTPENEVVPALARRLGFAQEGVYARATSTRAAGGLCGLDCFGRNGPALTVGAYNKLLRSPGVPEAGRIVSGPGVASTMTPVAFVLFARAATGSFATASLVLAASTAGWFAVRSGARPPR